MISKKITVVIVFLFFGVFSVNAFAANTDEYNIDWLEESGAYELKEYLGEESREYLDRLGCEDVDFENILSLSPKSVFSLIGDMLKGGWKEPFQALVIATGTVILFSVSSAFLADNEKNRAVMNIVCGCFLIISIFVPASETLKAGATVISSLAAFEKALIPVLAALLAASGNAVAAASVQGAAFAGAQVIESLARNFAVPLSMISGVLGMIGAVLPSLKLSAVGDLVRKTMTVILSAAAGLFTGFLAMKTVLAGSADGIAFRGVRFAANTLIPVVGGALSEAYSSLSASLSLVKNTVGIYAIIAFFVMTVPVIINFALWIFAMKIACCIGELLGAGQCAEIIKNIGFIFSMMNALIFLTSAVFIISAGLVVAIKSGV